MDDKTANLRDIFIDATGSDTVTERQEAGRGSLAEDSRDGAEARIRELVAAMRERYDFETSLPDDALCQLVVAFYDGERGTTDRELAAVVDADGTVDADEVFLARLDLHLVREADRDAPFDFETLRRLVVDGADDQTCATELGAELEAIAHYRRVVETEVEATRANDRYRDEFTDLLTDEDLAGRFAHDARDDGLGDATEDMETNVSF